MKNTLVIILAFLFLVSCKTETKKTSKLLCENQKFLLAPGNELIMFDFDLNKNPKEHLQVIKDSLKTEDLCDNFFNFNYKANNRVVQLSLLPFCAFLGQHFTQELQINISNQILFSDELTNINQLKEKIKTAFPFYKNKLNIIDITWEYGVSQPIINDVIFQISEGYLESLTKISTEKFNKAICDLSNIEIKKLKTEYPLTLDIKNISNLITAQYKMQKITNFQ
ncbi:hypothetical protein [Olleya namhaensis]|uniref:hypothetical protein n=1 Tax=Olleya namhaensis TaxID=1144750 RepID=UPI00232ECD5B|nr:hypothetical protein [Olleya namhaensis]